MIETLTSIGASMRHALPISSALLLVLFIMAAVLVPFRALMLAVDRRHRVLDVAALSSFVVAVIALLATVHVLHVRVIESARGLVPTPIHWDATTELRAVAGVAGALGVLMLLFATASVLAMIFRRHRDGDEQHWARQSLTLGGATLPLIAAAIASLTIAHHRADQTDPSRVLTLALGRDHDVLSTYWLVTLGLGLFALIMRISVRRTDADGERTALTVPTVVFGTAVLLFFASRPYAADAASPLMADPFAKWRFVANAPRVHPCSPQVRPLADFAFDATARAPTLDGAEVPTPKDLVSTLRHVRERRDELARMTGEKLEPDSLDVHASSEVRIMRMAGFLAAMHASGIDRVYVVGDRERIIETHTLGHVAEQVRCAQPLLLAPDGEPLSQWANWADLASTASSGTLRVDPMR